MSNSAISPSLNTSTRLESMLRKNNDSANAIKNMIQYCSHCVQTMSHCNRGALELRPDDLLEFIVSLKVDVGGSLIEDAAVGFGDQCLPRR